MSHRTGNTTDKQERVVDFEQAREQRLAEKRRKAERIFFKHLLGVYTVTGDQTMPIELLEVSETGCSFQVPFDPRKPWPADTNDIPLRLYFSQDTYLPIVVKVENSSPSIDGGVRYVRYGCSVDPTTSSFEAYQQFVRFLKLYAEHAHKDTGNVTLFYL